MLQHPLNHPSLTPIILLQVNGVILPVTKKYNFEFKDGVPVQ